MRFSVVFLGIFAALAAAESALNTATTATAPPSTSSSETPAQSAMRKCLAACDPGDVSCTSKCIAVPNPSASQANATNNCVAECPQGKGTATDNLNYQNCVAGCIGANYFTSTGTPSAATAAAAAGDDDSDTTGTGTEATGTPTGKTTGSSTSTGSASKSTSSSAAVAAMPADALRMGSSVLGLVGFIAAFLLL